MSWGEPERQVIADAIIGVLAAVTVEAVYVAVRCWRRLDLWRHQ